MDWPLPTDTEASAPDQAERHSGLFFAKSTGPSEPLGIVDCIANGSDELRRGVRFPARRRAALLLAAASAGVLLLIGVQWMQPHGSQATDAASRKSVTLEVPPINLPAPNLLRPISPEEAVKENAERPFVNRPDAPASRFVLRADAADRERALTCLAQAVYYEAAGEGDDGERAVAQVVLNRMRHPGFPASVCGVVYQGADRATGTGCQFTFACDGSLLRTPAPSLWARARKIAEQALTGKVFAPVGHATHYHADYVLPYWADSLDKTVQIGRHIFYRLPSLLGDSRSFLQHYAGKEPEIPSPDAAVTLPPPPTDELASALVGDAASGLANDVEKAAGAALPLAIDTAHGTLIADGGTPAAPAHRPKSSTECPSPVDRKQLAPIGANDLRAGANTPAC